jgi:hypothetical protein
MTSCEPDNSCIVLFLFYVVLPINPFQCRDAQPTSKSCRGRSGLAAPAATAGVGALRWMCPALRAARSRCAPASGWPCLRGTARDGARGCGRPAGRVRLPGSAARPHAAAWACAARGLAARPCRLRPPARPWSQRPGPRSGPRDPGRGQAGAAGPLGHRGSLALWRTGCRCRSSRSRARPQGQPKVAAGSPKLRPAPVAAATRYGHGSERGGDTLAHRRRRGRARPVRPDRRLAMARPPRALPQRTTG